MRWLLEMKTRIKKLVLIAPGSKYAATDADPLPSKQEFYDFEIDPKLKEQILERVVIFVSNDSPEILESVELYRKVFDANVIKLEGRGHFSFLIPQLPELVEEIIK